MMFPLCSPIESVFAKARVATNATVAYMKALTAVSLAPMALPLSDTNASPVRRIPVRFENSSFAPVIHFVKPTQ